MVRDAGPLRLRAVRPPGGVVAVRRVGALEAGAVGDRDADAPGDVSASRARDYFERVAEEGEAAGIYFWRNEGRLFILARPGGPGAEGLREMAIIGIVAVDRAGAIGKGGA